MKRGQLKRSLRVLLVGFVLVSAMSVAAPPDYPPVVPGRSLVFPRDYGAHPAFRIEWWYLTGWLATPTGKQTGFQVTFFRTRPDLDQDNPSRFAPKQLLFAHAAFSDPTVGHLLVDQRAAREGFGLAEASQADTDVHIEDWSLRRTADGRYRAQIPGSTFALDLTLTPTGPPMAEGVAGFSRKGPLSNQASYYYSEPQLAVHGTVSQDGRQEKMSGTAWLDHEWSTALLAKDAIGWDWIGINLDDGGALMAFQIRDASGKSVWASANLRRKDGSSVHYASDAVHFSPQRNWRSPRTGADYPVSQRVTIGDLVLDLMPLQDDQELDSRQSTGAVYWEGAVTALRAGKRIGRGYLELTGYLHPLKL